MNDLERTVQLSASERLRSWWLRLRLTISEMNYATRRMTEKQAPWIPQDSQRPRKNATGEEK